MRQASGRRDCKDLEEEKENATDEVFTKYRKCDRGSFVERHTVASSCMLGLCSRVQPMKFLRRRRRGAVEEGLVVVGTD